tara:strand:+ start:1003 stop:1893 length:891 start_codon:yes stop_codon:yes gene_type:complete
MIALSLKKNEFNFLSTYKQANQLSFEDYGNFSYLENSFCSADILRVKNRKKIKKTQYPSKNCMIFLESSEVILNQFNCPSEVSVDDFIDWSNESIFGKSILNNYSDYHYEVEDKCFLSVYIKKERQFELYNIFSEQNLKLKSISLSIFSADYLARTQFDADSKSGYMIWGLGKESDEILIIKDGLIKCLFNFKRNVKELTLINFTGCKKTVQDTIKLLQEKMMTDLKSFDITDKIYIYQKSLSSGVNKIYNKKNKDAAIVLNPIINTESFNKKKNNILESSYLAEMGYLFKTLDNS